MSPVSASLVASLKMPSQGVFSLPLPARPEARPAQMIVTCNEVSPDPQPSPDPLVLQPSVHLLDS